MTIWLLTPRRGARTSGWAGPVAGCLLLLLLLTSCARYGAGDGGAATPRGTMLAAAGTAVAATGTAATGTAAPGPIKGRCGGRIDSIYVQMLDAPDPAAFARPRGLAVQDGRVEARILLNEDSAALEADLVRRYGLRVTLRVRTHVEGFIPIATLCDFAQDPGVTSVGYPSRPKVWQEPATPTRRP